FRKAFEEGPVGILLGSPDFRILKANRALCKMLGYSEQELAGLRFVDITHPEDADRTLRLEANCSGASCPVISWKNATLPKVSASSGPTSLRPSFADRTTNRYMRWELSRIFPPVRRRSESSKRANVASGR